MADGPTIALRFAVYLALMAMFGLAAYPLYSRHSLAAERPRAARARLLAVLALLALVLSSAAFALMVARMAGVAIRALDPETIEFVLWDTAHGQAFVVRTALLIATAALALSRARPGRAWLVAAASGGALATLAWTGHAAATEGWPGSLHRLADVLHLLAASAWIGALAMMLKGLAATRTGEASVKTTLDELAAFAFAGSVIVAVVVASGLVNALLIVGFDGVATMPRMLYGQLLIVKLVLFGAMLGLAALNRWRLTPRLASASETGDPAGAIRAVRKSIALEAGAAIGILALVAWLGMLAPPAPP